LLALLGTPLLPAGLAALLVMVVVRFAPARRVREFLGLTAALVGISCSIAGQTFRVWSRQVGLDSLGSGRVPGGPGGRGQPPDLQPLLTAVRDVAQAPIPSFVAGRGLAAAGAGDTI